MFSDVFRLCLLVLKVGWQVWNEGAFLRTSLICLQVSGIILLKLCLEIPVYCSSIVGCIITCYLCTNQGKNVTNDSNFVNSNFAACKVDQFIAKLEGALQYSANMLATFLSLVLPPSGQRLSKLLSYCPQMGLTMLYAFEAGAAIASLVLNIFKRE